VECDYNIRHSCEESGCHEDGICRCGRITDLRAIHVNCSSVVQNIVNYCYPELKKDNAFIYFVDRIVRAHKVYDTSIWSLTACGGYYGQEVDEVRLDLETSNEIQSVCDICSAACLSKEYGPAIELVLSLEYGLVLDSLKDRKWTIEKVKIDDVLVGNPEHMRKVDLKIVKEYQINTIHKKLPVAICIHSDSPTSPYRLFDGYHRYTAATNKKSREIYIFLGS